MSKESLLVLVHGARERKPAAVEARETLPTKSWPSDGEAFLTWEWTGFVQVGRCGNSSQYRRWTEVNVDADPEVRSRRIVRMHTAPGLISRADPPRRD